MTELVTESRPKRPEFRNINAFKDLPTYRWPLASIVSGMHRASGALMLLLLPFIIWMFDVSISSEISFARFSALFRVGWGPVPGWIFKWVELAIIWAYLHHLTAGIRHLWMETNHALSKEFARRSAVVTLLFSLVLTAFFGAKLFGLY
jgi:succinate dehydrogenase / fumarate reductase, cytochrome b subunit